MKNNNNSDHDSWDKIPVKNRCQYLLFKHLILAEYPPTTYDLMKYGRTLDMCAPFGMTYNSVRRLVESWAGEGYIQKTPIARGISIYQLNKNPKGVEMLERLRRLFDDPV